MSQVTYSRKDQIKDQLTYLEHTLGIEWSYRSDETDSYKTTPRWTITDGSALFLVLSTREVEVWLSGVTTQRRKYDAAEVVAYQLSSLDVNVIVDFIIDGFHADHDQLDHDVPEVTVTPLVRKSP